MTGSAKAGTAGETLALDGGPKAVTYPPDKHKNAYRWHHKPVLPDLPGSEEANRTAIHLPLLTDEVPELVDQYVKAFEKVWAHRRQLAKA